MKVAKASAAFGGCTCVPRGGIKNLGYSQGGIAAGSPAAKMMSISAKSSGGGVPSGGVVATLQSAGASSNTGSGHAASCGGSFGGGTGGYNVVICGNGGYN